MHADAIADAARAAVEHHPDALRLVEADLDEVVAAAERAEVLRGRAAIELRMPFEDPFVAHVQSFPGVLGARRQVGPRAAVALAAAVGAAVRHDALDQRTQALEVVG